MLELCLYGWEDVTKAEEVHAAVMLGVTPVLVLKGLQGRRGLQEVEGRTLKVGQAAKFAYDERTRPSPVTRHVCGRVDDERIQRG